MYVCIYCTYVQYICTVWICIHVLVRIVMSYYYMRTYVPVLSVHLVKAGGVDRADSNPPLSFSAAVQASLCELPGA